ncbi:MAG: hypothetical protein CTR53_19740 [Ferrovibrio sp.]|nr:MAG: hypothetical protein CTR53_19740 [Ferrovibrio sp.]
MQSAILFAKRNVLASRFSAALARLSFYMTGSKAFLLGYRRIGWLSFFHMSCAEAAFHMFE